MRSLEVGAFREFFASIHGVEPFPWQERLLRQVIERGEWPRLLDLPTGSGKTAVLDLAVFLQALEAHQPVSERRAPRRTVLVVDRRTVVDQAYTRASRIAQALAASREEPGAAPSAVAAVSERLAGLAHGAPGDSAAPPLGVHLLRGGMPRDDDWARNPTQPLVAVSTVDQVGARLLFRGYGLSPRMQPIHAGLLANDVLFFLDEVHLAGAFRDLLEALRARYRPFDRAGLPDRWQVVSLSATPGAEEQDRFSLGEDDREHPILRRRLEAAKPTALVPVKVSGAEEKRKGQLAEVIAKEVRGRMGTARTIGVVVNRVQTARMVFDQLVEAVAAQGGVLRLVTGRMRPADREDLERALQAEVGSGRDRDRTDLRVIVATQCIEAGADFDFDVLLTECASMDALRQRFGRLNRLGVSLEAEGAVLAREDQLKEGAEEDPIYGSALRETWGFLAAQSHVDFGLTRLLLPSGQDLTRLLAPIRPGPLLLPAHLDAWVQTSPAPLADPEPALWLHGSEPRDAEVSVVWRADVTEEELWRLLRQSDNQGTTASESLWARLEICPPRSMEALVLPLEACRGWLRGDATQDVADAGALPAQETRRGGPSRERPAIVWRADTPTVVLPRALRPGEVAVVPSDYGGIQEGNWAPDSSEPVSDLGDRVQLWQRGRLGLRLDPRVLGSALERPEDPLPRLPDLGDTTDTDMDPLVEALGYLRSLDSQAPLQPWAKAIIRGLASCPQRELRLVALFDEDLSSPRSSRTLPYYCLVRRRPLSRRDLRQLWEEGHQGFRGEGTTFEAATDGEQASMLGREVSLRRHLRGAGILAGEHARTAGLSPSLCQAFALAGSWHDLGKADPRFQCWLHQGSSYRASVAPEPLAKSSLPSQDRRARQAARRRSGYPAGMRHELMSLALLGQHPACMKEAGEHWDLVLYLIGSHHGWCRPFPALALDPEPVEVVYELGDGRLCASSAHGLERMDQGIPDRFWRLVRHYGWYGLAWLEALFRLADHRQSEAEQLDGQEPEEGLGS